MLYNRRAVKSISLRKFDWNQRVNQITITPATPADLDDLFAWRNDPITQRASKNSAPIGRETHAAWFAAALASPDHNIHIGYHGPNKIGSIRFDRIGDGQNTFLVSVMIAPEHRGRGFGKALLRAGIETMPASLLNAEIAIDNVPSRKIFEACGFANLRVNTDRGLLQYSRGPNGAELDD